MRAAEVRRVAPTASPSPRRMPHHLPSVRIALIAVTLTAAYDLAAGPDIVLAGLLTVGPCLAAASASWRAVLGVGAYAVAVLALISAPDRIWWTAHQLLYLIALVAITITSALLARRQARGDLAAQVTQAQFGEAFDAATVGMALVREGAQSGSDAATAAGGVTDASGAPIIVNKALALMFRWDGGPAPHAMLELVTTAPDATTDRTVTRDDGAELSLVVTGGALPTAAGSPGLRLVQVEDVTVERDEHAALTRLAVHDQLTGLASRALLQDRLSHALHRVARTARRVAVLYLDLDGFKHINDSLGHEAGDTVLVEVARRLESAVRPEDTVARIGGDEFVVLLESAEHATEATIVAGRVQQAIAAPVLLKGQVIYPSASIGVALSGNETSPDMLLRDADTAMYQAKGHGKARAEVFGEYMRIDAIERLAVESGLHEALDRSELRVHLQPIVEPASGRVLGAEALVRWERPRHGLVPPASFVAIAEDCGLIGRIDGWVMGEAIAQAARYRRERGDEDFYVSINVSAAGLADSGLPDALAGHLSEHGLPADRVVIEITESVYAEAVRSTLAGLASLREMHVRCALDDFGTGFSSLAYIKRYPFDILKIDRSFVRGMLTDRRDAGIVEGVLTLARGLDLDVVAEGVESPGLAARLRELSCPMAQGFTWSEALPLAELTALPAHLVAT